MEHSPHVLFIDIETAPLLGYSWRTFDADIVKLLRDWYILSVAYKWQGKKKVHVLSLPMYPLYKRQPHNDRALVKDIWKLFNKADVIIAQNGDRFDIPKIRARMIEQGFKPPAPFQTVDTYKIAKSQFGFTRNSLDFLAEKFGVGRKLPHVGIDMWHGCAELNDPKMWRMMERYNKHDVSPLLEGVYDRLKPWAKTHPDMRLLTGRPLNREQCPLCLSTDTQHRGKRRNMSSWVYLFFCKGCGRSTEYKRVKIKENAN